MFFSWFRDAVCDINAIDPFPYRFTLLVLLFRFGYLLFARKHFGSLKEKSVRSSSDATWFLPVFIWGIESIVHLAKMTNFIELFYMKSMFLFPEDFFVTSYLLIVVVGLCFLQESIARRIGISTRARQATFPFSVLATILGVLLTWVFVRECLIVGSIVF